MTIPQSIANRGASVPAATNRLLQSMPRESRMRLLAKAELVDLIMPNVLSEPGEELRHVYFPLRGFISLVTQLDAHPGVEVGMIGREGMLGAHVALGVTLSPFHALVQGQGQAWQVSTNALRKELSISPRAQSILNRYVYVLMSQVATSAACMRFHHIGERLARWLLMSQDRADANRFRLTQEFLAYMLGVRRVGITAAASDLQKRGLISYSRGDLSVLNRKGLEAVACSCYKTDSATYTHQLR